MQISKEEIKRTLHLVYFYYLYADSNSLLYFIKTILHLLRAWILKEPFSLSDLAELKLFVHKQENLPLRAIPHQNN